MATLKEMVNSMVDQLSTFVSEVTHMALEVGMQGMLGGQATVESVQGTWADFMRNVIVSSIWVLHVLSQCLMIFLGMVYFLPENG